MQIDTHHSNCEVCNRTISYLETLETKELDYFVCRSVVCRNVMNQKNSMAPLVFKHHLEFNKKLIHQRREKELARKKHIAKVLENEKKENTELFNLAINKNAAIINDRVHLISLPLGHTALAILTTARIKNYIQHLNYIVGEASKYAHSAEVDFDEHHDAHGKMTKVEQIFIDNPELHYVCDELCSMCKGGCCDEGKEKAYLSVFSMRQFMDYNPELSAEDVLDIYLSNISSETVENSCINKTANGCALPRYLRSDICNGYYCDSLKHYQNKMADLDDLEKVFAVQRSYTNNKKFDQDISRKVVNTVYIGKERRGL